MQYRQLGRTGWKVSDISFGTWAIGGSWGRVVDDQSLAALRQAIDCGVNFLDTADVYGDGRSERLIAQLKKTVKSEIIVATKAGRRLPRQTVEGYSRQNLTMWVEDSLRNLSTDTLDLLQLHCPPSALYDGPEIFGILDDLVRAGKIRYYGVSVEKIDEALKAVEFPNVQTVQIIFNCSASVRPTDFSREQKKDRWASLPECRSPAACSQENCVATPPSRKTTTEISIATGEPSMLVRLFPVWITTSAWRRWKKCGRLSRPVSR